MAADEIQALDQPQMILSTLEMRRLGKRQEIPILVTFWPTVGPSGKPGKTACNEEHQMSLLKKAPANRFRSTNRCDSGFFASERKGSGGCGAQPECLKLYYSLRGFSGTSTPPTTMAGLRSWLAANGREAGWRGKLYVANTITWNEHACEFRQKGCSPNYFASAWSLACCKRDMRRAETFRHQVIEGAIPTLIFTVAKKNPLGFQALVSVARVTKHFLNMEEYASFLVDRGDEALISSRLTRIESDDGLFGWRFGDCHADLIGSVGSPFGDHVHGTDGHWQFDNDGTHLILFSDDFLLWEEPTFVAASTVKQSRYGLDVNAANLDEILTLR